MPHKPTGGRKKGAESPGGTPTSPIKRVMDLLGDSVTRTGNGWKAKCPAHDDTKASLSVTEGDDGKVLIKCFAGCETKEVVSALGLTMADLYPLSPGSTPATFAPQPKSTGKAFATAAEVVADLERRHGTRAGLWAYTDAAGAPVMAVVRFNRGDGSKDFRPVHRAADGWRVGAMPKPRPLYLLPGLPAAVVVLVCEGEKAADAARSLGFTVTTSVGGSQAAGQTDWSPLSGKTVVILPDNDPPGRKYADSVTAILKTLNPPPRVKVVTLPGIPEKGDVVDWLAERNAAHDSPAEISAKLTALIDATTHRTSAESPTKTDTRFAPELICAKDIVPVRVQWVWHGRVPLGRGTLIAGRGGLGKTLLLCDMAATITIGGKWPDGHPAPLGDVLFLSAEDGLDDTLTPRAMAAGADRSRLFFLPCAVADDGSGKKVRKAVDLKHGMDIITQAVERLPKLKLVIIDPIGSYLGRGTDSHRDNEVRDALEGIARLADERKFAVIFIAHVNKSSANATADDAILGSRAFSTFARATHHLVLDPDDKNRRLLMPGKGNLAKAPTGLAYTVEDVQVEGAGEQPRIVWSPDPVEGLTADELCRASSSGPGRPAKARDTAKELIARLLASGPAELELVKKAASEAGVSWPTMQRASTDLGVFGKPQRGKFRPGSRPPTWWYYGHDWQPPQGDIDFDAGRDREGQNRAFGAGFSDQHQPKINFDAGRTNSDAGRPASESPDRAVRTTPHPGQHQNPHPVDAGGESQPQTLGFGLRGPGQHQNQNLLGGRHGGGVGHTLPWEDADAVFELLNKCGWKWSQALEWLRAPSSVGLYDLTTDQRQRLHEHLARLPSPDLLRSR